LKADEEGASEEDWEEKKEIKNKSQTRNSGERSKETLIIA